MIIFLSPICSAKCTVYVHSMYMNVPILHPTQPYAVLTDVTSFLLDEDDNAVNGFAVDDADQEDDTPLLIVEPQTEAIAAIRKGNDVKDNYFAENSGPLDSKLYKGTFSCKCKLQKGNCSALFAEVELLSLRMHHLEMENKDLDLIVLAQIRSHLH